jgi:hypothetical protein
LPAHLKRVCAHAFEAQGVIWAVQALHVAGEAPECRLPLGQVEFSRLNRFFTRRFVLVIFLLSLFSSTSSQLKWASWRRLRAVR